MTTPALASANPWATLKAWAFLQALLVAPGFDLLSTTSRHASVLVRALDELPDVRASLCYDLYTAVVMREHGVSRIYTRDNDFHRFPFLTVVDPIPQDRTQLQA